MARTDFYGDPLPPGAVARLGTVRFLHGGNVARPLYSPDGKVIASFGEGGYRFWNAATGREIPNPGIPHSDQLFAAGGKLLAVGSDQKVHRVRDAITGKEAGRLPVLPGTFPLALSPDGRTLISEDLPAIQFQDLRTGKPLKSLTLPKDEWKAGPVLSADGRTLAVMNNEKTVWVFDVTARTVRRSIRVAEKELWKTLALSPDGKTLALVTSTAKGEWQIRLWYTGTGKERPPLLNQPGYPVNGLEFSPEGKMLASAYGEDTVLLWDLATRKAVRQIQGKFSYPTPTAFSPDGKRLAVGDGGRVRVWDVVTGRPCHNFPTQTDTIRALDFSPDGKTLALGEQSPGNRIHLWEPRTGRVKGHMTGHPGGIDSVIFSPAGRLLASAGEDHMLRLWDLHTRKEVRRVEGKDERLYPIAFSPDGKTLAAGFREPPRVRLWDTVTGREVPPVARQEKPIAALVFFPDGKTLATSAVTRVNPIRLWDLGTGKMVRGFQGHSNWVHRLAVSTDGRLLASGSVDGTIRLWDVPAGRELRVLLVGSRGKVFPWSVAFSPDGRSVAAASGRTVKLWEVASGRERARFNGHRNEVWRVVFSPDGRFLASGGGDHIIMVWDVTGQECEPRQRGELTPRQLGSLWDDLASPDAARAYRAVQRLLAAPGRAVPFLGDRLRPGPPAGARVLRLIADLDSDRFEVRQKAAEDLLNSGDAAEAALRKALAGRPSLEVRRRAEAILARLDPANSPARLRPLRALEVLEHAGTPEARVVLKSLAGGTAEARLTHEAKASLRRLARQPSGGRSP